jgi:hypothetical protein
VAACATRRGPRSQQRVARRMRLDSH